MSEDVKITRRELLTKISPLGKVTLDKARCTACGLCISECPTGALRIDTDDKGGFRIIFKHGLCTACGACREICPEKCLSVRRGLDTGGLDGETVLFRDNLVCCRECGQPVGPRTMLAKIRHKVEVSGRTFKADAGLCPDCRARAQLGKLRLNQGGQRG